MLDVIRMDEENETATIRYPEDCMMCYFCEQDCPEDAITISEIKHSPLIVSWG
jgi:NAD-dependent dihydropyrimidine dehydrogenase PreA subunit